MANRTIYLPEELDAFSRRLGLNLSQLTQQAIQDLLDASDEEAIEVRVAEASAVAASIGLSWPVNLLEKERAEAGER